MAIGALTLALARCVLVSRTTIAIGTWGCWRLGVCAVGGLRPARLSGDRARFVVAIRTLGRALLVRVIKSRSTETIQARGGRRLGIGAIRCTCPALRAYNTFILVGAWGAKWD